MSRSNTSTPPAQTRSKSKSNTPQTIPPDVKLLKDLVNEMKNDLMLTINTEFEKISESLASLSSQVKNIEHRMDDLSKTQCVQTLDINNLKSSMKRVSAELPDQILDEVENRLRRRHNIILSGVAEPEVGSVGDRVAEDTATIEGVARELGCDIDFSNVHRIGRITGGRPRLLSFCCKSEEDKVSLLRNAKKLRTTRKFKGVYINRDLTPMEQRQRRTLLEEMKRRRDSGEKVVIRHNKIVPQSVSSQNFH